MKIKQRTELVNRANQAAMKLMNDVNNLLDTASSYIKQTSAKTSSEQLKREQLKVVIVALGQLSVALGVEAKRWSLEEVRIFGATGIELDVLNELYVTIITTAMFFAREKQPLPLYSVDVTTEAYDDLVYCNRLL